MKKPIQLIRKYLAANGPSTFEALAKEVYENSDVPNVGTCDEARIATLKAMVTHREEIETAGFDDTDNPLVQLATNGLSAESKAVRVNLCAVHTSGNRTSWFKRVVAVDTDKRNGYAFEGEFLKDGSEIDLPVGAIIIEKEPTGSVKNGSWIGNIYRVSDQESDTRNPHLEFLGEYDWCSEFLSLRDEVARQLQSNH